MYKFEDLSNVLEIVGDSFKEKEWFGGIGTAANRVLLILVIDPDDKLTINELNKSIEQDIKELLSFHNLQLFFFKVKSIDEESGNIIFLNNYTADEVKDDEKHCNCGNCTCKKPN